jgi:uncharacterized membrane protein YphA (DoxX/SURF4 family)
MNLFARIAVGALLLVSGAAKLKSFKIFLESLEGYGFSRKGLGRRALAVAVPLAEVPTGIALILGWYLPIAIVAALFLFGIFTAAVTAALLRGRSGIPCGCMAFGNRGTISWNICMRNVGLGLMLVPGIWSSGQQIVYIGIFLLIYGAYRTDVNKAFIERSKRFRRVA